MVHGFAVYKGTVAPSQGQVGVLLKLLKVYITIGQRHASDKAVKRIG